MIEERTIAGFRLLRMLARGERSRVWLVPDDRVLKVLSPPVAEGQPALEAEALHRARGEHAVALLDASVDDEHTVLVFPRLPRGSLAELLASRPALEAGEAVTILAPLATCLARMHENGVAHRAVLAANVMFSAEGAPVLTGFGAATLFAPGLPEVTRETLDGVRADRDALAGLAAAVLTRVTGSRASAAAALAGALRAGDQVDLEAWLASQLFALAAARPVSFDGTQQPLERADRVVAVAEVAEPDVVAPRSLPVVTGVWSTVLESGPMVAARAWLEPRWRAWSPGRRRLTLGGTAALVAVVIAAAAVPTAGPADAMLVDPDGTPSAAPAVEPPSAVATDDPLVALPALLGRRMDCFRELSVLCIDDVAQPGSAAWADDRAALDAVLGTGSQPVAISAEGATLVERLGDSALIALAPDSDPASVLLMKGEAGWRIRDYLPPVEQRE